MTKSTINVEVDVRERPDRVDRGGHLPSVKRRKISRGNSTCHRRWYRNYMWFWEQGNGRSLFQCFFIETNVSLSIKHHSRWITNTSNRSRVRNCVPSTGSIISRRRIPISRISGRFSSRRTAEKLKMLQWIILLSMLSGSYGAVATAYLSQARVEIPIGHVDGMYMFTPWSPSVIDVRFFVHDPVRTVIFSISLFSANKRRDFHPTWLPHTHLSSAESPRSTPTRVGMELELEPSRWPVRC